MMLLIVSATSFSQQTTTGTSPLTKTDYLRKSKNQKISAWCLLGGGIFFTTLATTKINLNFPGGTDPDKSNNGGLFTVIGFTALGASIPLFNASSKNKKKAMSLSFKNEISPQLSNGNIVNKPVTSFTLKLNL